MCVPVLQRRSCEYCDYSGDLPKYYSMLLCNSKFKLANAEMVDKSSLTAIAYKNRAWKSITSDIRGTLEKILAFENDLSLHGSCMGLHMEIRMDYACIKNARRHYPNIHFSERPCSSKLPILFRCPVQGGPGTPARVLPRGG